MVAAGGGAPFVAGLHLAACIVLVLAAEPAAATEVPVPPSRPAVAAPTSPPPGPPPRLAPSPPRSPLSSGASPAAGVAPRAEASGGSAAACVGELAARGVRSEAAEPAAAKECLVERPVRLSAIVGRDGEVIDLPSRPVLACAFALRFVAFATDLVGPLASGAGERLAAIETGPGFECRRRNRAATGKTSAHGHGTAVDVSAFVMAGGTTWTVGAAPVAPGARTIGTIRTAACGWFTTVLGPGSDPSHAGHLHLDSEPHGRSERYRICD